MATRKKDGSFDCALCHRPRVILGVYTLCIDHMEEYHMLAEQGRQDAREAMDLHIAECLEKRPIV
jgi:hypothetical protein